MCFSVHQFGFRGMLQSQVQSIWGMIHVHTPMLPNNGYLLNLKGHDLTNMHLILLTIMSKLINNPKKCVYLCLISKIPTHLITSRFRVARLPNLQTVEAPSQHVIHEDGLPLRPEKRLSRILWPKCHVCFQMYSRLQRLDIFPPRRRGQEQKQNHHLDVCNANPDLALRRGT